MSETKFRGYGAIDLDNKKTIFICRDFIEMGNLERQYFIKWSQYTGLKDKNGKEIYEGDILKYDNGIDDLGNLLVSRYKGMFTIQTIYEDGIIEDEYYAILGVDCYGKVKNNSSTDDYEIIGNKYENPDLLNN